MLELAEQRSKELGMTSTNKFPLAEYNQEASLNSIKNKNSPTKSPSPTKKYSVVRKESNSLMSKNTAQRTASADAKENVDVALEINITTGPNVQVSEFTNLFIVCKQKKIIFFHEFLLGSSRSRRAGNR